MTIKVMVETFHNRTHNLTYQPPPPIGVSYRGLLIDEDRGLYYESNAVAKIHNWRSLNDDSNAAFIEAVDALDVLLEHSDHWSNTRTQCNFLVSEVAKVKDAEALKKTLRHKLASMQSQSPTKNIIRKQLRTPLQNMVNPAKPQISNPGIQASTMKQSKPNSTSPGLNAKREALIQECYQKLIDEAVRNYECDRIKANYELVAKRFKVDSIFNEHLIGQRSMYDAAYSIASCVASFDIPFKNAYNTALETCWYALTKKYIRFDPTVVIEAITDFFIFSGGLNESEVKDVVSVLEHSPILEADNHVSVRNIIHSRNVNDAANTRRPYNSRQPLKSRRIPQTFSEAELASYLTEEIIDFPPTQSKIDKIVGMPAFDQDVDIADLIIDFKAQCSKNESPASNLIILQSLVDKIVTTCPAQIPSVYRKLLDICRMSFVIYNQSSSIEEIIKLNDKLIKAMTDLSIDLVQTNRVIDALDSEVKCIQHRIDRLKDMDPTQQTKLDKYLTNLQSNLDQLKKYKEAIKSVPDQKDLPIMKRIKIYEATECKEQRAIEEDMINHRSALRSGGNVADGSTVKNNTESLRSNKFQQRHDTTDQQRR